MNGVAVEILYSVTTNFRQWKDVIVILLMVSNQIFPLSAHKQSYNTGKFIDVYERNSYLISLLGKTSHQFLMLHVHLSFSVLTTPLPINFKLSSGSLQGRFPLNGYCQLLLVSGWQSRNNWMKEGKQRREAIVDSTQPGAVPKSWQRTRKCGGIMLLPCMPAIITHMSDWVRLIPITGWLERVKKDVWIPHFM